MTIPVMVFLLTASLYAATAQAQPPTKVMIFQPYTNKTILNSELIIAQRYNGNCSMHSLANQTRSDAWRCQASNMTLDPCFEDGIGLACIISPWAHKVAILELNTPLHTKENARIDTNMQPWALELENGQRCTFLSGATIMLNRQRVNYTCGNYFYNVLGDVDRSSSTWKVSLYNYQSKIISKVAVSIAWF
jgi:hypothetical protein